MNSTSDKVRELYQRYPYPPRESGMSIDPYIDYILSFSARERQHSPTFLDAGCGTGASLLGAALLHKELQVFGCDFNPEGLAAIRHDVEELGLKNVTLKQVDLLDFPHDFGPERGFDVIFCTGVIHHTPDPLAILKNLASRLAPQGVLRLMVYARKGRADLYRFADTVKSVMRPQQSLEDRLFMAKSLMRELEAAGQLKGYPPPSLRGILSDSNHIGMEEFADRFVHPHDVPYDLPTLREHIEASGLKLFRWFEHRSWELSELLPEEAEFPDDRWERYAVVEELFDRDQYDVYLVRPEFEPKEVSFDLDLPLRLNPQARFTETTARGIGETQTLQLLFEPSEEISVQQGYICRALSRRTASLRELLQEWNFELDKHWFESARYLFERDYLFNPHRNSNTPTAEHPP